MVLNGIKNALQHTDTSQLFLVYKNTQVKVEEKDLYIEVKQISEGFVHNDGKVKTLFDFFYVDFRCIVKC